MDFSRKPSFKISCKTDPNFVLTIRDGKPILAPISPSDNSQRWFKEVPITNKVVDKEGVESFALVNTSTGQAIRYSVQDQPVSLVLYNPEVTDLSLYWSESQDSDNGFKAIRTSTDANLCFDAIRGDKDIIDGTAITIWPRNNPRQNNQWWKIENYPSSSPKKPTYRLYCKQAPTRNVSVWGYNKIAFKNGDPSDDSQRWYKEDKYADGFVLINKATGEALRHGAGFPANFRLTPYYTNLRNETTFWSASDLGNGFLGIRETNSTNHFLGVESGNAAQGLELLGNGGTGQDYLQWKFEAY